MSARLVPVAALLALSACVTPPEGATVDDVTYFEAAVATIGCTLTTDADFRTVEFQAGLTRQQVLDIAGQALATGRAERAEDGKGVRLIAGPCAPGAASAVQVLDLGTAPG